MANQQMLKMAGTQLPVETLGRKFGSDKERQGYFRKLLQVKLSDGKFRATTGFPDGSTEDIVTLSDPPYFTACPNPFIAEFINLYGHSKPSSGPLLPYIGELRSEERHPVYSFHPYHTKVPPEVIADLIKHYTNAGDLVLDGFSGTGMTAVAARQMGRHAVVSDLSPVAAFISGANCVSHDWQTAQSEMERVIQESKQVHGHLYRTSDGPRTQEVSYYVWSDVFTCPECVHEFPFFPHGVIHHGNKVETRKSFPCPNCDADLNVRRVERVIVRGRKKRALAWVSGGRGKKRINRAPNESDLALANKLEDMPISSWYPQDKINPDGYSARLAQLGDKAISDVSRFLSKRNLIVFADLWDRVGQIDDAAVRHICRATLTSIFTVISERQGYFGGGGGMSGNLYMPIVRMEKNIFEVLERKLGKVEDAERLKATFTGMAIAGVQSCTHLSSIPDASIDYVYTDPPFGANIIYSEMNLILEGWLKVKTNADPEAVIDESRNRSFDHYAELMRQCFQEYYRVLKPGRWITVEFHNTLASVWNLIQNAIGESGFVVAQVGVFDKGSTTILADIRPGAAKYDLIISAYKPDADTESKFELGKGTEKAVWEFVESHLRRVPVFAEKEGRAEIIVERTRHLLFDRMVAFHIQHGVAMPISAAEFYAGLHERYPERDGMFFLPNQISEYDHKRMQAKEVEQFQLFVTDEKTAIQWVRQQLTEQPRTYQQIQPTFYQEAQRVWQQHERPMELRTILEENFIVDAKGVWHVPDLSKETDLEQLRLRSLLKEFDAYRQGGGKLGVVRAEAVRAGFKDCWQRGDYKTIITLARRMPDEVVQEDPTLLMYYDNALMRTEG